jgi:hypothetical protein
VSISLAAPAAARTPAAMAAQTNDRLIIPAV